MFVARGSYTANQLIDELGPDAFVYVSGPMRGHFDKNRAAFDRVSRLLHEAGITHYNPPEAEGASPRTTAEYFRNDLQQLSGATAMVLVPGWKNSELALVEIHCALLGLDIPVFQATIHHYTRLDWDHDIAFQALGYKPRLAVDE
jgi:hypothetical protein